MSKDSFIIYKSFYKPIKGLSDKQLGRLFRALFCYQLEGSTQVDIDIQMAFAFFKNQMDLDEVKYQKVVERNKRNGSNGGRPPKEENPKNPVGLKKPKKPYNDNETVNDNVNKKKSVKEKIPPPPVSKNQKIEERIKREGEFYDSLIPFIEQYGKEMIRNFFDYWSEPNKSGTKMNWELQKTWDLSRRLAKWQSNEDKWSNPNLSKQPQQNEQPKKRNYV